jgi:hypothetical protein
MRRTELLQEILKIRFAEVYGRWDKGWLTQEDAAEILGVCDRMFRRYMDRYEQGGMEGIYDKRLIQASVRLAPVDEVMEVIEGYRNRYPKLAILPGFPGRSPILERALGSPYAAAVILSECAPQRPSFMRAAGSVCPAPRPHRPGRTCGTSARSATRSFCPNPAPRRTGRWRPGRPSCPYGWSPW